MDQDFSDRWERHISALRNDFSTSSIRAMTSGSRSDNGYHDDEIIQDAPPYPQQQPPPQKAWNDQYNSLVDSLDDMALQQSSSSPNTITTNHLESPRTPWFTDTETQTTLSSPETTTSWPKPSTTPKSFFFLPPQTPQTTIHSPLTSTPQQPPPTSVSVLLLSWAPPTARIGSDGQLLSPSLPTDTDSLRSTLKKRGYRVQCRVIPADYPTSAVEGFIDRFLYSQGSSDLMMIYYRGFGWTDGEDRLVFSSGQQQFYWDDVRDPIMQFSSDVLMIFDCTALNSYQQEIRLGGGPTAGGTLVSRMMGGGGTWGTCTKQVLGVCVAQPQTEMIERRKTLFIVAKQPELDDSMARSLCSILGGGEEILTVQRICSLIREDLRRQQMDSKASKVFVTQLGGGQLLDIYLPRLEDRRYSYSGSAGSGSGSGGGRRQQQQQQQQAGGDWMMMES
ncbi:hypothetical protein QBC38DRAFT_96785 [Podospora fimiseda]|uniref:Uncharacterized protein n=1 Tax=Podospora fimiseda TaxID=252190 RepID=A0AAN7C063_9PEZI|nr:hypothetical protein QBC38DRAFT_96785 [Podospora fimiseda]